MATRVVEWKKPYTWWKAISIDENKVISLNLRDENNLIIYDAGDDEIYVDLQLPDGIEPTDAFPVWITTGRVLVADDWDITGTIICAKTTSGDNIKLLYGDNGTLWMDNGTGTFKQIYFKADVDAIAQAIWDYINANMNLKAFAYNDVQGLYDWISQGKFGLVHRLPVQWFKMDVIFPPTNVTTWTVSSWVYRSVYQDDSWQYFEDDETLSFTVSDWTVTSWYNGTTQNIHNEWFLVICSSVAPWSAVEWCVWYDTVNDVLKVYDGSQWNAVWGWTWDVVWPSSSTDWHLAVFDWATWKLLKDWWAIPTWVPAVWSNGQVLTVVSWAATWANPSGWSSTITVTLASANWSSKEITVSATWVTASNTVIVSPAPADINDYATNSVYCSAQWSGTLTFTCNTEPTTDIDVNVLILN